MRLIVTITGASGVGKSTLEHALAARFGGGRVLTISTRAPRADETEKDRFFQTPASLEGRDDLVWKVTIDGNIYAATRSAFEIAFAETGSIAFVAITPERHELIANHFASEGIRTLAIHLVSPSDEILRARLWSRHGTTEGEVARRRMRSCNEEILAFEIAQRFPIHFIEPQSKEAVFQDALRLINDHLAPN
jgi:guanylate kinase